MNRAFSLYLDILRLTGAVMVLLAHWAFPRFTGEDHLWMRRHDLGGDGVVIFFVLSGLLIAFAANARRDEGAAMFAADRFSRLWSVSIPVIILGIAMDMLGQPYNPDIYAASRYEGGIDPQAIFAATFFLNQIWFVDIAPGANAPYWSLGYEAWYYAIFAGFFFAPRYWRWWIAGALALIAGPKILLLIPSWLMGVGVWHLISSGRLTQLTRERALLLTLLPLMVYWMAHTQFWHANLTLLTQNWLGIEAMRSLGPSDTFIWATILGILMSVHLAGVYALCNSETVKDKPTPKRLTAAVQWLAGGSFALYLMHFPVLNLIGAVLPGETTEIWRQAVLLIAAVAVSYGVAEVTERRRPGLRRAMRNFVKEKGRRNAKAATP